MSSVLDVAAVIGRPNLIGASAGSRAAEALLRAAEAVLPSPWLAFDFQGIEMVSASAAREALLKGLTDALLERGALPVALHLNTESLDEVNFAAQALKRPLVVAAGLSDGRPTGLRVLGGIESKQMETLRTVARLGGNVDASAAHKASSNEAGVTAWNNRLANLSALRLLQERKVGKTKYYSLTLEGLVDGN